MRTITGQAVAWLSQHGNPRDLNAEADAVVARVYYTSQTNDMSDQGWTRIGVADITLTLATEDEIVAGKVECLRVEQKAIRARAEAENTRIEGAIQKLLAIGFDAPATYSDDIPF